MYQNVQGAIRCQPVLDYFSHLPGVRDVCWDTDNLVSLTGERCGRTGEFVCLAIGDDEPGASPCKRLGYGTSKTLRRASDERNLAC